MTHSTASFIDQLEQAASGKDLVLEPVVELIESIIVHACNRVPLIDMLLSIS